MITKTSVIGFFSKTKVIFATIAAVITFGITLYNQFKTNHSTEISGIVSSNREQTIPVDAIVKISSPVQAQTETDSRGRFKFKLQNLQSDTFLLIVQNKKTNTIAKQNEYVSVPDGRKDIVVFFDATMKDGQIYMWSDSGHQYRKQPNVKKFLKQLPKIFR